MNSVNLFFKLKCPYCKTFPKIDVHNLDYEFYVCKYSCQKFFYFMYNEKKISFYILLSNSLFEIKIHFNLDSTDPVQFKFIESINNQRWTIIDLQYIPDNLNYQDPDQLINQLKLLTIFK